MLVEKEVQKILNQLADGDPIRVSYNGSELMIRFVDEASKLSMTTSVYNGSNYIPSSVRKCLTNKLPDVSSTILTFLTVDETHYQVNLNYLGRAQPLNHFYFKELVDEFGYLAEEWRFYLDEHDKHDLVHVRVPKN
jgi:hypothetical protein